MNAINAFRRDPTAGIVEVAVPAVEAAEPDADIEAVVEPFIEPELIPTEDADAVFAEFFPDAELGEPLTPEWAVEQKPAAVDVPHAEAAMPVVAAVEEDFDPELLEIFLEEAGEIVDDTSEQLAEWRRDTNNSLPVQQLQRGLHTLKGGARMAEITPLGDLAHHMENLYEALCDGRMSATEPLFGLLNRCHDRLAAAVESLCNNNGCPDLPPVDEVLQSPHGAFRDSYPKWASGSHGGLDCGAGRSRDQTHLQGHERLAACRHHQGQTT